MGGLELKDEEVQLLIIPGVHRPGARHAPPDRPVLMRALQREQQRGIGAGQPLAHPVLARHLFMQFGRTGRSMLSSTAFGRLVGNGIVPEHRSSPFRIP
jgi:hypothetical protein